MKTIEKYLESSDYRLIIGLGGINYGTILHAASLGGYEKIA